jgi:xylose isomerase
MMSEGEIMREYGAGIWLFGQFVDRYASDGYGPGRSTVEAIELAATVKGMKWLDINYPFNSPDETVEDVAAALDRTGLKAIAITPHIYMRQFRMGSFTNPDPAIRQAAIDLCKTGVDIAGHLNASYLKFWPGQDGHDYPFQADFSELWDLQLDGVRAVVESAPEQQFAIEYKLKEPRLHMTFSTAARTLLGIEEIGADNLGVVLDMGHSLFAKETPADVLHLINRYGRLTSVEVNDNLREWDDDMIVGSAHPVETLEFLWALRQIDWDKPILLDQFPFREDPAGAADLSIKAIEGMERILDRMDTDALRDAQSRQDSLAAQALVLGELIGARD